MRSFEPTFEPNGVVDVRRVEVITGIGGRRSWSRDDKARIIAESLGRAPTYRRWRGDTGYGRSRSMLGVGWLVTDAFTYAELDEILQGSGRNDAIGMSAIGRSATCLSSDLPD